VTGCVALLVLAYLYPLLIDLSGAHAALASPVSTPDRLLTRLVSEHFGLASLWKFALGVLAARVNVLRPCGARTVWLATASFVGLWNAPWLVHVCSPDAFPGRALFLSHGLRTAGLSAYWMSNPTGRVVLENLSARALACDALLCWCLAAYMYWAYPEPLRWRFTNVLVWGRRVL
jgi:hypothetical protein